VPINFTEGYGMDSYNGGTSGIMFGGVQRELDVPVATAETLLDRFPKNFRLGRIQNRPMPKADADEEVEDTDDPAPTIGRVELSSLTVAVLRRQAAGVADDGETVPRKKAELVDFIIDHQED